MGQRGRAKKPDVLAKLEGRPHSDRLVASGSLPAPPAYLSDDAVKVWCYVSDHAPPGLLASVDAMALGAYCEAVAEFSSLARWCIDHPDELVGYFDKGGAYQHPNLGLKNRAAERLLKFGDRFGFTPASRASIGATLGKESGDAFGDWLEENRSKRA